MEENSAFDSFELQITNESKEYLRVAAKWSGFLAIVGFVFLGLGALGGFSMLALGSAMGSAMGGAMGGLSGSVFGIFYLLVVALAFIPTLYLYKFSSRTKQALLSNRTEDLTESMKNLKSYFRFMGIFTLIVIVLYILLIVIGIGAAASMGGRM
ncbi:hypothetical protein GN157_14700 [Flavobacterium rakeshii]|uniref:DUF5362 domain-containing protein n=1 Tax=Flavobacterium rakeshii TaxID=1038845 RepID=A0A6N8HH01_9FLAO|nr:DUF5362 family protein [Flavobacterium rakeshii]MUV04963.1 hypothetical protein [Flavobacterium rakeshii]